MTRITCPECAAPQAVSDSQTVTVMAFPNCKAEFVISNGNAMPKPANSKRVVEIAPCPKCGTSPSVEPRDIDTEVECPESLRIFTARQPGTDPVREYTEADGQLRRHYEIIDDRPRLRRDRAFDDDDEFDLRRRHAGNDGEGLAITAMVMGILSIPPVMCLWYL